MSADPLADMVADALERATARLLARDRRWEDLNALTAQEVAGRLQVSTSTVYRMVKTGVLPTIPNVPDVRIPVAAVARLFEGAGQRAG